MLAEKNSSEAAAAERAVGTPAESLLASLRRLADPLGKRVN
jgi:hypothetical protein